MAISTGDLRYLEAHSIPRIGDLLLYRLCTDLPDDPYAALAETLAPLANEKHSVVATVPPPVRPIPPQQKDYLSRHRVPIIMEEWLFTILSEKPTEPLQFSYRYFLRNAMSRNMGNTGSNKEIPSEDNTRYAKIASPVSPRIQSARKSPISTSSSPLPLTNENYTRGGYSGDVSPRVSSREPSPPIPPSSSPSLDRAPKAVKPSAVSDRRSPQFEEYSSSVSVSPVSSSASPQHAPQSASPAPPSRVSVLVLVYSHNGHCFELATAAVQALHEMDSIIVDASLYRFPNVISEEVLTKTGAKVYEEDDPRFIPELKDVQLMKTFDAFMFVFPTRFGSRPAAVSSLLDATGDLWLQGALVGKPAGVMVSTGTQHGGHETTIRHFHRSLLHHGMIIVGVNPADLKTQGHANVEGGSYYGAGTVAGGSGERDPSDFELNLARKQAVRLATFAAKLFSH